MPRMRVDMREPPKGCGRRKHRAFNRAGELFTYDSDMEWDQGSPWYVPTRIVHAISGGDYGWRSGAGRWPAYYADSLPPVLDVGPGSPTGITFGTKAKFPAKYQRALFACDSHVDMSAFQRSS